MPCGKPRETKDESIFIVGKGDLESVSQDNTGGNADEKGVDCRGG